MITLFNRKELICTFDMKKQAKVSGILDEHHIDYRIKTSNRKSPCPVASGSRSRTGTYGKKTEFEYEYRIFVKKEEFEKAKSLIYKGR